MKKSYIVLTLVVSIFSTLVAKDAVTYNYWNTRFGDKLICYLHAKWISYRWGIPLLYKPFDYSSKLVMDREEIPYDPYFIDYNRDFTIKNLSLFARDIKQHGLATLYAVPYFPEDPFEIEKDPQGWSHAFKVEWKDPGFRKVVQELIAPIDPIETIKPAPERVNVALHFRSGRGFDPDARKSDLPTKFPPFDFYVEGLKKVIELFDSYEISCFIFTDDPEPEKLMKRFQKAIAPDRILFNCRSEAGCVQDLVLEDFFSLFNFDILIRGGSNYSMVPSLIHDFALVYSPRSASKNDLGWAIDRVNSIINRDAYNQLLARPLTRR